MTETLELDLDLIDTLKEYLIESIRQSNDVHLLEEITSYLLKNEEPVQVTPEQEASIRAGLEDMANGRYVTQEELLAKYRMRGYNV
jgi:predicted transcriptional regulator